MIDDEFNRLEMDGEKRFAEEAAEAMNRVIRAIYESIDGKRHKIDILCHWGRRPRIRQMQRVCDMMEKASRRHQHESQDHQS